MSKVFCRDDTNFSELSAVEILKKYFQNNISIFEESLGSFCMLLIMATTGWLSGEKFPENKDIWSKSLVLHYATTRHTYYEKDVRLWNIYNNHVIYVTFYFLRRLILFWKFYKVYKPYFITINWINNLGKLINHCATLSRN